MLAFSFFGYLTYKTYHLPLPSSKCPIIFYSNSTTSLRQLILQALSKAETSLELTSYALTDEAVLTTLFQKKIPILKIQTDHKTLPKTFKFFQENLPWELKKTRGLMHEKILLIDELTSYLGSANMTYESLKIHENFIMGIYDKTLAQSLSKNVFGIQNFCINNMDLTFCRLPCKKEKPLELIKNVIETANVSINIAMFTLTHKSLIQSLIMAKQRGVLVKVFLDRTSSNGASKNAFKQLQSANIPVYINVGQELLHHKMMLVDNTTFVLGSANWTGSAFTKNQDFFIILQPLKKCYVKSIKTIFKQIEKNTKILPKPTT